MAPRLVAFKRRMLQIKSRSGMASLSGPLETLGLDLSRYASYRFTVRSQYLHHFHNGSHNKEVSLKIYGDVIDIRTWQLNV